MEGLYSVFVRGVWGMWVARGARVEQYGPRGIPIPFYRAGRWSERGVDDPESVLVRSTDVRSAAGRGRRVGGPCWRRSNERVGCGLRRWVTSRGPVADWSMGACTCCVSWSTDHRPNSDRALAIFI